MKVHTPGKCATSGGATASSVLSWQRSYRKELFDDAVARMTRAKIKTETEIERFRLLQAKVDALVVEKLRAEVDYGEIPDEFRGMIVRVF